MKILCKIFACTFLVAAAVFVAFGCGSRQAGSNPYVAKVEVDESLNDVETVRDRQNDDANSQQIGMITAKDDNNEYADAISSATVWLFENQTIKQVLEVSHINDTVFQFHYKVYDKTNNISHEINGTATHNPGKNDYGVEMDEDEDGAYMVNEYIYDAKCWLAFRIDAEEGRRMIIKTSHNAEEFCNNFNSRGILEPTH